MVKRIIIMLIFIGGIFGSVFYYRISNDNKTKAFLASFKAPPVTVATMTAETASWTSMISAVGSLEAVSGVDVTVEFPGIVTGIHFQSGQRVNKGELIVTLDTRSDIARLESLKASEYLAILQLERRKKLVDKKMTPQSELDKAEAEYKKIKSQVDNQEIMIDKKRIKSPFSGILGIRKIDVGQYLSPGMPIVSLQTIDPIFVDFTMPQQRLKDLYEGQQIKFTVDSWKDDVFTGKITAIEPNIDRLTRNFNLRAIIDNKQEKLRPGMFGTVAIDLSENRQVIALPQTAINYNPYGDIVFVAEETEKNDQDQPMLTAKRKFVVTGERRGDLILIEEGLNPGEQVVIMGHHKLKDGDRLIINNSIMPDNDPSPDLLDQ